MLDAIRLDLSPCDLFCGLDICKRGCERIHNDCSNHLKLIDVTNDGPFSRIVCQLKCWCQSILLTVLFDLYQRIVKSARR